MKFYVVVNHYLVSLSKIFHEDWCTNERARVVNAVTRDKTSAQKTQTGGIISHPTAELLSLLPYVPGKNGNNKQLKNSFRGDPVKGLIRGE